MATDTARIDLELASGRSEVTAPFYQTSHRRRQPAQEPLAKPDMAELPASAQVIVEVPLGSVAASSPPLNDPAVTERPVTGRPTWIALIGATAAVAAAVWWVMFQRLPDIDPRDVIQRNLSDARSAMAEARYTDPPERSAFHHYSTVLALDPENADAIAGIDAIADRHLTDARVLLADQRVAEAAVAIDRARRVRPNHSSLPNLDTQLRGELKKILAAANSTLQVPPPKTKVAKAANVSPSRSSEPSVAPTRPPPPQRDSAVSSTPTAPPESHVTSPASTTRVVKELPLLALAPANAEQMPTSLISPATDESGSAPAIDEAATTSAATSSLPESAPAPVQTVAPKLIKMVQPEYPQEALMRGIEGWVDVSLQVNAAGDVITPRIEDSSRGRLFNRAALSAVQQWKYEPRPDGESSERVRVRLQFRHSK